MNLRYVVLDDDNLISGLVMEYVPFGALNVHLQTKGSELSMDTLLRYSLNIAQVIIQLLWFL